jgi:predicted GNAT family acetyltransferase
MSNVVRDNRERHRFELEADGQIAFSKYARKNGIITFIHTEVPKALEGRGIASALVKGALDLARVEGVARCPFVKVRLERHRDYSELVKR